MDREAHGLAGNCPVVQPAFHSLKVISDLHGKQMKPLSDRKYQIVQERPQSGAHSYSKPLVDCTNPLLCNKAQDLQGRRYPACSSLKLAESRRKAVKQIHPNADGAMENWIKTRTFYYCLELCLPALSQWFRLRLWSTGEFRIISYNVKGTPVPFRLMELPLIAKSITSYCADVICFKKLLPNAPMF